jgi:hypothetical protein
MKYDIESMMGRVVALRLVGPAAEVRAALVHEGFTVGEMSGFIAPILRGAVKVGRLAFADNGAEARIDVAGDIEIRDVTGSDEGAAAQLHRALLELQDVAHVAAVRAADA